MRRGDHIISFPSLGVCVLFGLILRGIPSAARHRARARTDLCGETSNGGRSVATERRPHFFSVKMAVDEDPGGDRQRNRREWPKSSEPAERSRQQGTNRRGS
jgi:hypothetical protein